MDNTDGWSAITFHNDKTRQPTFSYRQVLAQSARGVSVLICDPSHRGD